MYKILITGSIHEIGLEILRKEKDIEIHYAPDLPLPEIFEKIAPFHCIIGLGNVGHRVARYAKAFEMEVIAYDPYIADEVFVRHHARKCSWDELISSADIITLHVPKTVETTGMIGKEEFHKMKTGVVVLNSARGGIINEKSLLEELKSGKVAAAGIDTWEEEPPQENPFRNLPQVVMSPHVGASTSEAQMRIAESIATQAPRALRGEVVEYPVNMPSVQVLGSGPVAPYTSLAEKLGVFSSQYVKFTPNHLEIKYRGKLAKHDTTLLRLCFLKGFLQSHKNYVSYVNADQQAENVGLHLEEIEDSGFTDYESAIKCTLVGDGHEFSIGGVVFSGPHPRITLINGFDCEFEAEGTIMVTTNQDRPGMVGILGTCLGKNGVNIDQFQLARNTRGGEALSLIRVDDDLPDSVTEEIRNEKGITSVIKIVL